eukprot:359702-Chlamydomonas_euryale.AAC.12
MSQLLLFHHAAAQHRVAVSLNCTALANLLAYTLPASHTPHLACLPHSCPHAMQDTRFVHHNPGSKLPRASWKGQWSSFLRRSTPSPAKHTAACQAQRIPCPGQRPLAVQAMIVGMSHVVSAAADRRGARPSQSTPPTPTPCFEDKKCCRMDLNEASAASLTQRLQGAISTAAPKKAALTEAPFHFKTMLNRRLEWCQPPLRPQPPPRSLRSAAVFGDTKRLFDRRRHAFRVQPRQQSAGRTALPAHTHVGSLPTSAHAASRGERHSAAPVQRGRRHVQHGCGAARGALLALAHTHIAAQRAALYDACRAQTAGPGMRHRR